MCCRACLSEKRLSKEQQCPGLAWTPAGTSHMRSTCLCPGSSKKLGLALRSLTCRGLSPVPVMVGARRREDHPGSLRAPCYRECLPAGQRCGKTKAGPGKMAGWEGDRIQGRHLPGCLWSLQRQNSDQGRHIMQCEGCRTPTPGLAQVEAGQHSRLVPVSCALRLPAAITWEAPD